MGELKALYDSIAFTPDQWELALRCLFQILLLLSSAVFSGSETALFSISRIDLQKLRQSRDKHSESIHAMLDEPRRLIISILCGNELVNIASAVNMAGILLLIFGEQDISWINIIIMVPLLLLIGEVTPKTIAVSFPVKFTTRITARILPRWIIFITPLREVVRLLSDRITTLVVGDEVDRENILQPDELRILLEEGEETGVIDATERVLIDNLLEASETDISRIMTPGPRILFLDAVLPVTELIEKFRSYCHPRIPVYEGHWDNVIGFIHSEDILKIVRGGGDLTDVTLDMILKPAHFVPPTKKVDEMFDYFQAHNTRVAIILGEYGEVLGIVTMKDVLKFIFGEITGKMVGQEYYQEEDENSYTVPGDMRLTDFYNLTNFDIEDPVMTTIGGVAFRLFDRLPKIGDSIIHEGYEFITRDVTGLRISKLLVRKLSNSSEEAQETEEEEVSEALDQNGNSDKHLQVMDIQEEPPSLESSQSEVTSKKQEGHDEPVK
ncbi:hemolysin family protein [Candidatus Vondammii sp. HM_W22]|uniref:hemolysin family protein n=1 Tax=Candidatus Vondammii sp. HM_W22 TaxID=2687299 RepID=UPI002E7B81DE|nr:hemolysin family protein [Candidatus Vondammii sp. HM_W22]